MRIKHLIFLMLAVFVTTNSCSAKSADNKGASKSVETIDAVMQKAVGDSIYRIITNAKKIEIASLSSASEDVKTESKKKVSSKDFNVVNFIVTNPKNYLTNTIVYGIFAPQFKVTYTLKKEVVTLKYDFGLGKWGIFDSEDKEIGMYDLASDNMLRFACQQFPDNKFFQELLMTREQ